MSDEKLTQTTDSLINRLAGPSTGKAGLAKDQTEINRIIAAASKGSKFYENEKRKDAELTIKINNLLKTRDDLVRNAELSKVEHAVDNLIIQLEQQRDLSQVIVHVDMDAFFANVELLYNPSLAGKPFGVGHGVLSTTSYEARKYGVRSGMPTYIAKKLCPELIVVAISFGRYNEASEKAFRVFRRYDPNLCVAGCDEGYLNITSYCEEHNVTPSECIQELRQKVYEETSLTASAGIAPNLMLAKICSDKNKPNGQFELTFTADAIIQFMHDLPIRKIPGIGRVAERLLDSIGIQTCGDIYSHRVVLSLLDKHFGLESFLCKHLGIASNVVTPHQREERKSIGSERTFHSLSSKEKILEKLDEISSELAQDMEESGWAAMTITVKYKLDTYQVSTRAKSCDRWITKKDDLYNIGKELLLKEFPMTIRLLGLRATKLKDLRNDVKSGIKRFFDGPSPSPRKRLRVNEEDLEAEHTDMVVPDIDSETSSLNPGHITEGNRSPPVDKDSNLHEKNSGTTNSSLICPICSKFLETDNDGFNAHIDFCLSRGAIQSAHAEAGILGKPKSAGSVRKKPPSAKNKPTSSAVTPWTISKHSTG